jgi:hypothetical protein
MLATLVIIRILVTSMHVSLMRPAVEAAEQGQQALARGLCRKGEDVDNSSRTQHK